MKKIFFIAFLLLFCLTNSNAQQNSYKQVTVLQAIDKKMLIDSLCKRLSIFYVSAEKATEITKTLQNNLQNGLYDKLSNPVLFAEKVNEEMRKISKDKHLNLAFDPVGIATQVQSTQNNALENLRKYESQIRRQSYGLKEIKMLEGNIGYFRIDEFVSPAYSAENTITALNFLATSNAIILDMRYSKGGDVALIQVIISQLYKKDTTIHLNNFYHRASNTSSSLFTIANLKGTKMPNIPVYVLISKNTFSAAEALAYNLQSLHRATIVGEVSAGGANAGNTEILTNLFSLFLPTEKTINPITGTNWEGVGVIPDVKIEAEKAVEKAQILAAEKIVNLANGKEKTAYQWTLEVLQAKEKMFKVNSEKLQSYIGVYGVRTLSVEKNKLYYQRAGKPKIELLPVDETTFYLSTSTDIKLKIVLENQKNVAILLSYQDGGEDRYAINE
jgi:hypothetical protein